MSADASHVVTGIPSASRSQAVREGQQIRGPYTAMSAALAAYDRHLGLTTARRRS